MSYAAARRRATRAKNPYSDAQPAPLKPPTGCMVRCPDCLTRCLGGCCVDGCQTHDDDHEHYFACDH